MTISPLLARYSSVLLDLDGCVWVGEEPTARAAEAVQALRGAGKRIGFVTNDGRRSEEEFVRKLWGLGFKAAVEEVVTVGGAVQHLLAERADRIRGAFVIGSQAMVDHVADAGVRIVNNTDMASRADLVVVGGFEHFDYAQLRVATQAVLRGADLMGTDRDATFPAEDGPWPATGSIVAAVEYATGRTATIIGKPSPELFRTALDRLESEPGSALVIGDRLDADVAGAHAAGIDAAVVLTGTATREDAEAAVALKREEGAPRVVAVGEDLASLVLA